MNRADMDADAAAGAQHRVDGNSAVFVHKGRALEIGDAVFTSRAILGNLYDSSLLPF